MPVRERNRTSQSETHENASTNALPAPKTGADRYYIVSGSPYGGAREPVQGELSHAVLTEPVLFYTKRYVT